jgi:hypothetical protein
VIFSRDFFDLQIRFARDVSALTGLSFERCLLDCTNLYIRFALGRDFDPAHPVWRDYLAGLATAAEPVDWTYRFFLARPTADVPSIIGRFGCFAGAHLGHGTLRLHFENTEKDGRSPLAADRCAARHAELRQLLGHVRDTQPSVRRVAGTSWLYNLPAYRRLFPAGYVATARVATGRLRNMPLWGQFLDRHGAVRREPAALLFDRLARLTSPKDLAECFPLQPLALEAPVEDFFAFLDLPGPRS